MLPVLARVVAIDVQQKEKLQFRIQTANSFGSTMMGLLKLSNLD